MKALGRIARGLCAAAIFTLAGALAGLVIAAIIGLVLFQPGIGADISGMAHAYFAVLIAGTAAGAVVGMRAAYREED